MRVSCIGTRGVSKDREVADTAHVTVEVPGGHTMYVLLSSVNEQGIEDLIRGHKATLRFGGDRVRLSPERAYAEEIDEADVPFTGQGGDVPTHQRDWLAAIRTGKKPNGDIGLAVRVQTIVALAEMAMNCTYECHESFWWAVNTLPLTVAHEPLVKRWMKGGFSNKLLALSWRVEHAESMKISQCGTFGTMSLAGIDFGDDRQVGIVLPLEKGDELVEVRELVLLQFPG